MSAGKMFLSAVLAEKSVAKLLSFGTIDHLFKGTEKEPYEFVRSFVKQYQALPSAQTIKAHTGENLVEHIETSAYYFDLLQARYTELEVKRAMKAANDLLLPENKDPEEALRKLSEMVMEMAVTKYQTKVVDFRHAAEMLMNDYVAKFASPDQYGLQLGWPTVDNMSGGLVVGDKVAMVGRPAAGKTWQLLYSSLYGWLKAEKTKQEEDLATQSRMFVSMEMGALPINQRLASIVTHLPASQIKHAKLSSANRKFYKDALLKLEGYGAPYYVVDGNLAATVEDIWMLARQLKPAAIFIDGGYLVKHPTERDRYRRVAENAELMKSELASVAPCVVSWQFARSASKKNAKKGEKADLSDIGYTDAIGQVSSLVLGMFEEENVETLQSRKIEILKGRNGETGSFRTSWNFKTMDFSEMEDQEVGEMQFL